MTGTTPGPWRRSQALRMLSNGVYVMTARDGDRYGAATVTWVSQASFRPPMLMAAVRSRSNVFACLKWSGFAALHVLAHDQQEVARRFFAPTRAKESALNGEPFVAGLTKSPILTSAPAYIEGRVRRIEEDLGDHALIVLEVVAAECRRDARPLLLADSPWEYGGEAVGDASRWDLRSR